MERTRLAPLVGIVGCGLVATSLAVPYVLVRTSPGTATSLYYGASVVNPLFGGLLALVAVIVLAAGSQERTDPVLAAGIALSLGVFLVVVVAVWAVTVPRAVVVDMDAPAVIEHHRWATTAVAAVVPLASGWWARTLGLL